MANLLSVCLAFLPCQVPGVANHLAWTIVACQGLLLDRGDVMTSSRYGRMAEIEPLIGTGLMHPAPVPDAGNA